MGDEAYKRAFVFQKSSEMLRKVIPVILQSARKVTAPNGYQMSRAAMSAEVKKISDEEFDENYVQYFNRADIDGWEVRKAMHDLHLEDLVPEPKIIIAALQSDSPCPCRFRVRRWSQADRDCRRKALRAERERNDPIEVVEFEGSWAHMVSPCNGWIIAKHDNGQKRIARASTAPVAVQKPASSPASTSLVV